MKMIWFIIILFVGISVVGLIMFSGKFDMGLTDINPIGSNTLSQGLIGSVSSKVTTSNTPTSDTTCTGNKCTTNLFSGIVNVYEDKKWKKIEEARSLKGSGINCSVKYDGKHYAECLDWNYTARMIRFKIDDTTQLNKNVPITVFEGRTNNTKEEIVINLKDKTDEDIRWIKANINDEIHFGENSTVITAYSVNTDTYIDENNANTNYGNYVDLDLLNMSGSNHYFMLQFSIGSIPNGSTILSGNLRMDLLDNNLNSGESFKLNIHHLYNQTWVESYYTWNKKPPISDYNLTAVNSQVFDNNNAETIYNWDVKGSISLDFNNKHSFYIIASDGVNLEDGDELEWTSYEGSVVSGIANRPNLTITYNVPLIVNTPVDNDMFLNHNVITINTTNLGFGNTVWGSIDSGSTNFTLCTGLSYCENTTINSNQGYFNLTVWANDSGNNIDSVIVNDLLVGNQTRINITKDTEARSVVDYLNKGQSTTSVIGKITSSVSKSLLFVNFSLIGTNAEVVDSYLGFVGGRASVDECPVQNIYEINHYWQEGDCVYCTNNASINGTTWTERYFGNNANDGNTPFDESDPDWEASGLGSGTDYNSTIITSFLGTSSFPVNISVSINNSYIQRLIDNPSFNEGFLIVCSTNDANEGSQLRTSEYADPSDRPYYNITYYTLSTDTCTCAGLNQDWEIDHSDACTIDDNCDLGTGTLSFTGTGTTICDAIIDTTNLGETKEGGILQMNDDCVINVI